LGGCPQSSVAAQERTGLKPLPAPLLPVEEAWNVLLPSAPSAQGALDEERVYIPLQSGQLIAINRETGESEWTIAFRSDWTPLIDDDVLYIAGTSALQAIRTTNGERIWQASLDAELLATPVMHGGVIALLLKPDQLQAVGASDGSVMWRTPVDAPSASPVMAIDKEGVSIANGNRLSRFASTDGHRKWVRELSGVLGRPMVAGDRVFVGSTDNFFYALDERSGRLEWRYSAGGDVVGSAADDRFVYVASLDNLLRALRRGSGNQVWRRNLSTRTVAPPSTFGGVVLVPGNAPTLSSFDASTGDPIASYSAPAALQGVPLVDSTLEPFRVAMIAVTRDARAIGLRPMGMMFREPPLIPLQTLPGRVLSREPLQPPTPKGPATQPQSPNTSANRRAPSSIRSGEGAENDSLIVLWPVPSTWKALPVTKITPR
jgi:outer membrane protein assembly factor BamB